MGALKAGKQNTRTIQKNNTGTYSVSLPIGIVREMKWQQGQKVVFEKRGKTIVIKDWE